MGGEKFQKLQSDPPTIKHKRVPLIRPLGITNPSNELLSHILLYGWKDLSADLNKEILQGTICFIRESGRFDSGP